MTNMGPAAEAIETPNPKRKRPPMNWSMFPFQVVDEQIVPAMTKAQPMNIPILRPYLSLMGPTKGSATRQPIWYIEVTIPAQAPLFSPPNVSKNVSLLNKAL